MGKPLAITRTEHAAADLRAFAAKSRDGAQVRRLLALAFILDGHSRTEAAERAGMERQTLRDWVHRYNAEGIAGLIPTARNDGRVIISGGWYHTTPSFRLAGAPGSSWSMTQAASNQSGP